MHTSFHGAILIALKLTRKFLCDFLLGSYVSYAVPELNVIENLKKLKIRKNCVCEKYLIRVNT